MKAPRRYKTGGETPKKAVKVNIDQWSPEMESQAKKAYDASNNDMARKNYSLYGANAYHAIGSEGSLAEDPLTKKQYTDFELDPQYKRISGAPGQRIFESTKIAGYGNNEVPDVNFPGGKPIKYIESTNADGTRRLLQMPTTAYKPNELATPSVTNTTPPPFTYNVGDGTYAEQENKWKIANPGYAVEGKAKGGKITKAPKRYSNGTLPSGTTYDENGDPIDPATLAAQQKLAAEQKKQDFNKGYLDKTLATATDPNTTKAIQSGDKGAMANVGIGLASDLTKQYAQGKEMDLYNTDTEVSDKKAMNAAGLSAGATGAKMGAKIGLNPELLAATGGLSALAIPVGAGIGYAVGRSQGRKKADAFNYGIRDAKANKLQGEQQDQFATDMNEAMTKRQEGYNKGGYVNGLGTGTSDSVKAKIKPGSFITPAKNAKVAEKVLEHVNGMKEGGDMENMSKTEMEQHHKKMMKAPMRGKKADLDQEGGEEVRLSKGEFVFTPEQRKEIISELGEDVLESLAPDAEHGEDEMKNGGLTAAKAKIILHDGTIRGKAITDKQRKYFGAISNGYKCGGGVDKMADGGVVKTKGQKLVDNGEEVTYDGKYWVTKDGNKKIRGDYYDSYLKQESDKTAKEDAKYQVLKADAIKRQSKLPATKTSDVKEVVTEKKTITAPKIGKKITKTTADVLPKNYGNNADIVAATKEAEITPTKDITSTTKEVIPETDGMGNAKKQALLKGGLDAAKQIGGLANYIIPAKQVQLGRQFLAASGKRPVDKIDPDFQNSVNQAQANAKYGYTPEEQALIDQRNISALRSGENAARNYSGGSAGNALSLQRQAANDYFSRGLQSAISSKNLQMDKQSAANALVQDKAEMKRRLFGDTMNAFQQNQIAGGNLIGSGLNNAMAATRLNREMAFQNKYAQNSNPYSQDYFNGLGS